MKFKAEQVPFIHHPAYIAWSRLSPGYKEPDVIQILTQDNGKPYHGMKRSIYKLSGAGINGDTVIAKKAPLDILKKERFIYEKIIPKLPAPSLHYYGFVVDSDNNTAWIFLEEGKGRSYSEEKESDRILAAQWLGILHSATCQLDDNSQLKDHRFEQYHKELKSGHTEISTSLIRPDINNDDASILKRILLNLEIIDSRWAEIAQLCDQMPRCVVHGDFFGKNVKVNIVEHERRINVFDWEHASRGVPAVDLGALDFTSTGNRNEREVISYRKSIQKYWPDVDKATIQQWIYLGLIFKYLSFIEATSKVIKSDWIDQPLHDLKNYNASLAKVLIKLKWIQPVPASETD